MPTIHGAVIVTASVNEAATPINPWGTPAVVGASTATAKNTPKRFTTLADIATEHGNTSPVYTACSALFAQGIREIYTVAATIAGATPTPTEIETALATLAPYAGDALIHGVCLAGILSSAPTLTPKLKAFAEASDLIFTMTNDPTTPAATIVTQAAAAASANGYVLAHRDAAVTQDIGAAALGAILARKPWVTMMWKPVTCAVAAYYSPADLATLETGNVNVVMLYAGSNVMSANLTSGGTPKFIDITRTKFYAAQAIRESVANLRATAEKIPYSETGLEMVRAAVASPLEDLVRGGALLRYAITMPQISLIDAADRTARTLSGVVVQGWLAGDIETFSLEMTLEV